MDNPSYPSNWGISLLERAFPVGKRRGRSVTVTKGRLQVDCAAGPSAYEQKTFRARRCATRSRGSAAVSEPQRLTVERLCRAAENVRDLGDPVLMATAWDEPATSDVRPAPNSARRFGQLQNLSVPASDDPLSDREIAAREDDSLPKAPGDPSRQAYGVGGRGCVELVEVPEQRVTSACGWTSSAAT
jgi:hypothetical protein